MNSASAPNQQPDSRSYQKPAIRPEMTVRQVATDYPACREVFVECGEPTERPGRFGHFQPLTNFARDHGIVLDQLLERLTRAAGIPVNRWNRTAETIHRRFVIAALAITLTLGAGWGGWLLLSVSLRRDFDSPAAAHIVAHGEAQLWGFIGLFVVGISLRTVLIDAVRDRSGQHICTALLAAALLSLAAGFVWSLAPGFMPAIGLAGGVALLFLSLTLWSVHVRLLRPKWRVTWARAVMASGFWLVIWAATTCLLRWKAGAAGPGAFTTTARLLLIELAVFGFAMNSIYGFGQMLLPGLLRTGKTRPLALEAAFCLHNLGLGLLVIGNTVFVAQILTVVGLVAIAAGTACYATGQHAFLGKPRTSHRPEQGHWLLDLYIPLAFSWLVLSMLLLVAGNVYELAVGAPLPHAWVGAIRHALTVGFMTTLILGVGQRLLPVLEHTILARPGLVLPILILIAAGNLLRVICELATMQVSGAYVWMPVSALLEWLALLLFTISVGSVLWRRDPLIKSGHVTERSSLAVLLAEYPWMEDQLIDRGSSYLARARTIPHELTIGSFAESEGRAASDLVYLINDLLDSHRGPMVGGSADRPRRRSDSRMSS